MLRDYDPEAKMILALFRKNADLSMRFGEILANMGQFYYWSTRALTLKERYKKMDVSCTI